MTVINSILTGFANLLNTIKQAVVNAHTKSFQFIHTKFSYSSQCEDNNMNLKDSFLVRLIPFLYKRINLIVQIPMRLFGSLSYEQTYLIKTEGDPMKLQELFQAICATLLNLKKRVVQNPKRLFRFIRTEHNPLKEGVPMKLRELLTTRLSIFLFNRRLVAQIPIRISGFSLRRGGQPIKVLILLMIFSLLMIPAGQVQAASFTVNSTADLPDANPGN